MSTEKTIKFKEGEYRVFTDSSDKEDIVYIHVEKALGFIDFCKDEPHTLHNVTIEVTSDVAKGLGIIK